MNSNLWKRLLLVGLIVILTALAAQVVLAQDVEAIVVSATTAGTTEDGLDYDPWDLIVRTEGISNTSANADGWWMLFNGEEVGLGPRHNINSVAISGTSDVYTGCGLGCVDAIYMNFTNDAVFVPGITPKVLGQDIVAFYPDINVSEETSGTFELLFDGSDVGLTTADEKVDGLDAAVGSMAADVEWPADCSAGALAISTRGSYKVPAANGGTITGDGSDVLIFCATNFGASTAGFWFKAFDSEANDINPRGAIANIDVNGVFGPAPTEDNNQEDLTIDFSFIGRTPYTIDDIPITPSMGIGFFTFLGYYGPLFDLTEEYPALNGQADAYENPNFLN